VVAVSVIQGLGQSVWGRFDCDRLYGVGADLSPWGVREPNGQWSLFDGAGANARHPRLRGMTESVQGFYAERDLLSVLGEPSVHEGDFAFLGLDDVLGELS
jgi:hypothetical protein